MALQAHARSAIAQLGHTGRSALTKAQRNPDRFRAMASEVLRKSKGKLKREDKSRRLRRYLEKRHIACYLAAGNRSLGPEQRHHRPVTRTSTPPGPEPVTRATTHLAKVHLPSKHEAKKRQRKSKGGALRPLPSTSANAVTPRFFTLRVRTVCRTGT